MGVPARSYYPPLPPAVYDWTGIYLGGHIGGGILVDSVSQNGVSPGGFNLANTGTLRPAGVIGGAQVGANYEFAPWVVGIEGSWTDSAIDWRGTNDNSDADGALYLSSPVVCRSDWTRRLRRQ
jgi:outer membrane immunogenic protein